MWLERFLSLARLTGGGFPTTRPAPRHPLSEELVVGEDVLRAWPCMLTTLDLHLHEALNC